MGASADLAPSVAESLCILFYCYENLGPQRAAKLATAQSGLGAELGLRGRVLVADEGINGTVQGSAAAVAAYEAAVEAFFGVGRPDGPSIDWKRSAAGADAIFPDFAVKEVAELVGFGLHGRARAGGAPIAPLDVRAETGTHLMPAKFHELLRETSESDLRLLDVRNSFEYEVGHFEGACDVGMSHTAQWARYVDNSLEDLRGKRVMMYCTGGIRCEKASAYLKRRLRETELRPEADLSEDGLESAGDGRTEVFQLQGGIHRYLEAFPDGGLFRGANFVFDKRAQMKPEEGGAEAQASKAAASVGRCSECGASWDRHHGGRVCCVCRSLVLVCDSCDAASEHGEYYCSEHRPLRGVYYHFVDRFRSEDLRRQLDGLRVLLAGEVGPRRKNRRNTLRKKIEQIEAILEQRAAQASDAGGDLGAALPQLPRRCRACEKPYAVCPGACWGFWREPGRETEEETQLERPLLTAALVAGSDRQLAS